MCDENSKIADEIPQRRTKIVRTLSPEHMKVMLLYWKLSMEVTNNNLEKPDNSDQMVRPTASGAFSNKLADIDISWQTIEQHANVEANLKQIKGTYDRIVFECYGKFTNFKNVDKTDKKQRLGDSIVSDRSVSVFRFAKHINIDEHQARYLIDNVFESRFTFQSFSRKENVTHEFCENYSGIYLMYRLHAGPNLSNKYSSGVLLSCPICIRYPINYKHMFDDDINTYKRIRAKALIPNIKSTDKIYQYDGYCVPCAPPDSSESNLWHWILQQRHRPNQQSDMISMFTTRNPSFSNFCSGYLMTQAQTNALISDKPIVSQILIRKLPEFEVGFEEPSEIENESADPSNPLFQPYPVLLKNGEKCSEGNEMRNLAVCTSIEKINSKNYSQNTDNENVAGHLLSMLSNMYPSSDL